MFISALAQLKNRKRKKDWSYFRFDNALLINYLIEILQLFCQGNKIGDSFLVFDLYSHLFTDAYVIFSWAATRPINVTEIAGLSNRLFLIISFLLHVETLRITYTSVMLQLSC